MRKGNTRISFFAFQDIITATTGILVLITIILTFFLKAGGAAPPTGPSEAEIDKEIQEFQGQIAKDNEDIAELKGYIGKWGDKDSAEIERQIAEKEALIAQLDEQLGDLNADQMESRMLAGQLANLKRDQRRLDLEIDEIKKLITNVALLNDIFRIPGLPTGKKQLLILMATRSLEVIEFAEANMKRDKFVSRRRLLENLGDRNPKNEYHLVFLVKPSGIEDFMLLNGGLIRTGLPAPVKELGYDAIGWEPVGEDFKLQ